MSRIRVVDDDLDVSRAIRAWFAGGVRPDRLTDIERVSSPRRSATISGAEKIRPREVRFEKGQPDPWHRARKRCRFWRTCMAYWGTKSRGAA